MLCKVTHCVGRVSVNTRPHQLRWGDWEMWTAISCTECNHADVILLNQILLLPVHEQLRVFLF